MQRFIKKLFLFLALFSVWYVVAIVALAAVNGGRFVPGIINKNTGFETNRLAEVKRTQGPVDIVFLGSSETFTGFDPRVYDAWGLTSYNMGSNAQTPYNSLLVYERWVRPLKPRLLVFDAYWRLYEIDGVESQIDILTHDDTLKLADVGQSTAALKDIMLVNSLVYEYARQVVFHRYPRPQKDYGSVRYVGRGHVENPNRQSENLKFKSRTLKSTDQQFAYLEQILAVCQRDDTQVLLVKTPVTDAYYNSIADLDTFFDRVRAMGKRHGARFVDFNDVELDQQSDFLDRNHLSSRGVAKFNAVFAKWLSDSLEFKPSAHLTETRE